MATKKTASKKTARRADAVVRARSFAPRVVTEFDILSGDPASQPTSSDFGARYLGEGDSWFTINAIPRSANLLEQLPFSAPSCVLTLANPGDTIRGIAAIAATTSLAKYLADPRFAPTWDAILLSGGGNDLIGAIGGIVQAGVGTNPSGYLNVVALTQVLDDVDAAYATIVALRDRAASPNSGVLIVTHTYDYATPRNSPARFFGGQLSGPWLFPAFEAAGITDVALRFAVMQRVIDALAERLLAMQARFDNFAVIDTRGLLTASDASATGNSNDWLNEIHPNSAGYAKVAAHVVQEAGL